MRIHRIELPTPFAVGPVNAYLLADDPPTLIDAGPKTVQAQAALEAGVTAAGRSLAHIRRILITHGHTDHFGNAAWVAQRSDAPVYAHADDGPKVTGQRWVLGHMKTFFTQAGLPQTFLQAFTERLNALGQYFDPLPKTVPLRDGDTVELGPERLRVLHTPGHSRGHVSFYHDDGVLIAGDLLLDAISPNPVVEFTRDGKRIPTLPQYLQSLRRVLLLNCEVAHPGHGGPITNPNGRIRELITHHEERKEALGKSLGRTPKTLLQLCQALFPQLDEINMMLALSEVAGHLDLLTEEKRVSISRKKGILHYRLK